LPAFELVEEELSQPPISEPACAGGVAESGMLEVKQLMGAAIGNALARIILSGCSSR
jgi:hypothetical protein